MILFSLPGNNKFATLLAKKLNAELGEVTIRRFPDLESYVRIQSNVKNKCVVLVCTLHQPDEKLLPLFFLSETAKDLGAKCVCLVTPYLAYMRQDKMFNPGEAITSTYFGNLISSFANSVVTVDPHLHRRSSMREVYKIPSKVIHAANAISKWIKNNIENPVLIGPDSESEQWVSEVAKNANAPFIILHKERHGDRDVEISKPVSVEKYKNSTPVLVDDIISTAHTMIETIEYLKKTGMKPPICIGIHAVFAGNAYQELLNAGAKKIITANTIPHESNHIDLSDLIAEGVKELMA